LNKKITLIGFMAVGKTTIAKALNGKCNIPHFDLDAIVIEQEKKPISQIIHEQNEDYFRAIENKCLVQFFQNNSDYILSVGGGTPCFLEGIQIINNHSNSVFLFQDFEVLYKRIIEDKNNRFLAELPKNKLHELFKMRNEIYVQAKHKINIENKSIEAICSEILTLVK
jgi:shikimate kinase